MLNDFKLKDNPFQPAKKEAAKLRLALMGASGSGKTWTALLIAERLCELEGGKIAFLDTEGRSARKYADRFSFDVYDLSNNYRPERYIKGIQGAAQFGYTVVVVDSFSRAWTGLGGVLDIVDNAAQKMGGNSFAGWSKGRPAQNNLVDMLINADIHIIGTMRSKTEWLLETDPATGKTKPVKRGLAAVQSSDFEYEFDVVMQLDMAHIMTVSKSRCHSLQAEQDYDNPVWVATELRNWLTDGEPVEVPPMVEDAEIVDTESEPPSNGAEKVSLRQQAWDAMTPEQQELFSDFEIYSDFAAEQVKAKALKVDMTVGRLKTTSIALWEKRIRSSESGVKIQRIFDNMTDKERQTFGGFPTYSSFVKTRLDSDPPVLDISKPDDELKAEILSRWEIKVHAENEVEAEKAKQVAAESTLGPRPDRMKDAYKLLDKGTFKSQKAFEDYVSENIKLSPLMNAGAIAKAVEDKLSELPKAAGE